MRFFVTVTYGSSCSHSLFFLQFILSVHPLESCPSISPSLFPVRFPLASATHSPDIERTSRGREGATPDGRVFPLELADWLAAAVAFTDLPQPAGSGDRVCPFRNAALSFHFDSFTGSKFRECIRKLKTGSK